MQFISEILIDDGVLEREVAFGDIPGILWTPGSATTSAPVPLILIGHPGGISMMYPRLAGRARAAVEYGFAAVTVELPGSGDRPRLTAIEQARAVLDGVLALPEIGGPVGYSGGLLAIGIRLALVEPRVVAAGLFAGSFIPAATFDEARRVTIPLHVLLQWDDENNGRRAALDLFDALGSKEKTLQANVGGHTGVPRFAAEDAAKFFARHLGA